MFGSPTLDAIAAVLAAAVYYLWPFLAEQLGGQTAASPAPFSLPVALPRALVAGDEPEDQVSDCERLYALQRLARYYRSIQTPEETIDQLLAPHLKLLVAP